MRISHLFWAGAFFSTASGYSLAMVDATMGPAGFTGLAITPSARILDWGVFSFSYDNQLPGIADRTSGHNFVGAFGLLPNLEIAGRIATNEINSNCYIYCGARDLSGSGKFGIGLDAAGRYRIAAGVTDLGGKVNYFRSYYGVATYSGDSLDISLGVAKRKGDGIAIGTGVIGSESPLHGPFGSVAYQPTKWMQANIEYSDSNSWAGLKLFAPDVWLPRGWKAFAGLNLRLNKNSYTERSWASIGVSIPLYTVPSLNSNVPKGTSLEIPRGASTLPVYEALVLPKEGSLPNTKEGDVSTAASAIEDVRINSSENIPPRFVSDEQLRLLALKLRDKGFEDISVGRTPAGVIAVRLNNAIYNWNSLDALGVALGIMAENLGSQRIGYSLILTQRQLPLVAVTGQSNCLREWVNSAKSSCTAGQLYTPGVQNLEMLHEGVGWSVSGMAPSWKSFRIGLAPVVNTAVATEYGLLDYSFGAKISFVQPLWSGAYAELRRIIPLADSDDYKENKVYADSRLRNVTDRAILTQTLNLPLDRWIPGLDSATAARWGVTGVSVQGTAGRINEHYDGVHGEIRWEPGEGRHRFGLELGRFDNSDYQQVIYGPILSNEPKTAKPFLASYRYAYSPTRTYFELSGGQYMFGDRGFYAGMAQWFGDVAVSLYYRRTKFEQDASARQFVGVQVSMPIGPRKDMNPTGHFQITGNQRVGYGVETLVRANTLNYITLGHGVVPSVPTLNEIFNSDRAGLIYFEDNMRRIRDAARS